MSTELENAQTLSLLPTTSQINRLDSAQSTSLLTATSQIHRLDSAQSVALVICRFVPRRRQSIVIVAN